LSYASLNVANPALNESVAKFAKLLMLLVVNTLLQPVAFFAISNTPDFSALFFAISSI